MSETEEIQRFSFAPDDRITHLGTFMRFKERAKYGQYFYEAENPRVYHHVSDAALRGLLKDRTKFKVERNYYSLTNIKLRAQGKLLPLGDLEDEEAAGVHFRYAMVMSFRDLRRALPLDTPDRDAYAAREAFKTVAEKNLRSENPCKLAKSYKPTPLSTLLTWHQRLQAFDNDPRSLIDGRINGSGNRNSRFAPEVDAELDKAIEAYLSRGEPTIQQVWNDMDDELYTKYNVDRRNAGLPDFLPPCIRTLGRRIAKIEKFVVCAAREGIEAAERKYRETSRGLQSLRPGQRLEVDGWLSDLHTLLHKTDAWQKLPAAVRDALKVVRITFIVVIDSATRCIVAIKFTWKETAKAIRDAVRMAMEDKTSIAKAFDCKSTWPMYGYDQIVHDNAPAYTEAAVMEAVLKGLGTEQHSVAGIPWLRGRVERFFRTLATQLLGYFIGQTGSNPRDRNEFQEQAYATVTYEELVALTIRWVVDVYHNQKHEGLGTTPRRAWFKMSKETPPFPSHGPERLCEIFGIVDTRVLDGSGVQVANSQYQSDKLKSLRRKIGDGKEVTVKIDYQNLGLILVRIPDNLIGHNDLGADAWIVVDGPPELVGVSQIHLELVDDEMAMRFGYDNATTEMHRREARMAIKASAREAAKRLLTDQTVDLELIKKRQSTSYHAAMHFGDAEYLARVQAIHAPVPLAKAKGQPVDDFDLSDDTTPISYKFRD